MARPQWYWMGNFALVVGSGHRPVVISGRDLMERDATGRLVPLDPQGKVAETLARVPQMLDLLDEASKMLPVGGEAEPWRERLSGLKLLIGETA